MHLGREHNDTVLGARYRVFYNYTEKNGGNNDSTVCGGTRYSGVAGGGYSGVLQYICIYIYNIYIYLIYVSNGSCGVHCCLNAGHPTNI